MIVSNSSPLIALSRIGRLDILAALFGKVIIPTSVYQEVVIETKLHEQRDAILAAVQSGTLEVMAPTGQRTFRRRLGAGEQGVLTLAVEKQAALVILDDKRARNEAKELGLPLAYTADLLKAAVDHGFIESYTDLLSQLVALNIFLPE